MYAYLKGKITEVYDESCVIEVNNIGYNVHVCTSTSGLFHPFSDDVKLYTYTHVREDAIQLFGFLSQQELKMFKLLITVNGIGPKVALSILSAIDSDAIRFAVITGDVKTLSKAPGIGKKTAERMILDLKDKVSADEFLEYNPVKDNESINKASHSDNPLVREAAEALTALGYSSTEALKAVRNVSVDEDMSVEDILKAALIQLY